MRIGFFTDSYFPQVNGVTYTLHSWKRELELRGHRVLIYYPRAEYEPKADEYPVSSIGFSYYPGYRIAYLRGRLPKVADLDIIHQHGMYTMALIALSKAWWHRKPKISTFHTPGGPYIDYLPASRFLAPAYKKAYLAYERLLLNSFDHVTTGSDVIRDMLSVNGVRDIEVLSNGIDPDLFRPAQKDVFRKKHGVGKGPLIGFCGRIGFEKRLEDLIGAAKLFEGTVLIAGEGPALGHYKKMASDADNIVFLGFIERNELSCFYSALDAFVFPSHCETQGLVAVEAMACGTPVVAAPVMALRSTVEHGLTGYHYDVGDHKDLVEKVMLCQKNRKRLSKACVKKAKEHSVKKTVDRLEQIYESFIRA